MNTYLLHIQTGDSNPWVQYNLTKKQILYWIKLWQEEHFLKLIDKNEHMYAFEAIPKKEVL